MSEVESERVAARRHLRPTGCRKYFRDEVAKGFPKIVEGFLEKAFEGSVQHVKLALEMTETRPRAAVLRQEKGAAQLLMEELGLE